MGHKTNQSNVIPILWILPLSLSFFPVNDALSSPLLEQLVSMKTPGSRDIFTLFDIIIILLLIAFYLRSKKQA